MRVLIIGNEKGGVGKTRTACEIACRLANNGFRVVLIDADSQGHVARNFGLAKKPDFYDVMVRDVPIESALTAISEEKFAADLPDLGGALWVLRSNIETRGIRLHVDDDLKLYDEIQRLEGVCDIVIIDTSPAPTNHSLIMRAATDYLMVSRMEYLSVDSMMETISHIQRYNRSSAADRQIKFAGILPTMFKANTVEHTTYLNALREREDFTDMVLPPISESIIVPEADRAQLPLLLYAGSHKVALEYYSLTRKLIAEVMHG